MKHGGNDDCTTQLGEASPIMKCSYWLAGTCAAAMASAVSAQSNDGTVSTKASATVSAEGELDQPEIIVVNPGPEDTDDNK